MVHIWYKETEQKQIIKLSHEKDFYSETVLTYKTKDGYTGYIVKIRSKRENEKK